MKKVCITVFIGWSPPKIEKDECLILLKPVEQWTNAELEMTHWNSKAIHAIFNTVSINQMKVIVNREIAKDA